MAEVKFRGGEYLIPGTLTDLGNGTTKVTFRYNKAVLSEIKAFEGSRWNPEGKFWTIKNTPRNKFQLEYLTGGNPYRTYDQPLIAYQSSRPLRKHQLLMTAQGLTYRQTILAAEMGTGKSLSAIEIIENAELEFAIKYPGHKFLAYWVAPKSALRSVELELIKWNCKSKNIKLHTYESLKKLISNWKEGDKAPFIVIFDESSRAKSPTAQRSQAAYELANGIRDDWPNTGYVIPMSGTPAPKSPADWWMQCEIAQPGFIKEGTYDKFKKRMGLIIDKESIQGGVYPHLVTWLDDENKCSVCGKHRDDPCHSPDAQMFGESCSGFVPSVNEVAYLYERMKGLVLVVFKKDCLDLPDKQYEVIRVKPSQSILRSASIITARSTTVVGAMVLLRELSDGFQYEEEETGTSECSLCHGKGLITAPGQMTDVQVLITDENIEDYREADPDVALGDYFTIPRSIVEENHDDVEETSCPKCGGSGQTVNYKRIAVQIPCPKEDVVKELLDRYDDVGRTVFFGGFSASIDRLVATCLGVDWHVIRVDGRGWWTSIPGLTKPTDMLMLFQDGNNKDYPRVAFIGQPGAAGMGLTLTASPMICYYSNDFNAESRVQSEDRIHRMGMDVNRGATIYDLVHLPTDELVLKNLQKKRDLQAMSMGDMRKILSSIETEGERKF